MASPDPTPLTRDAAEALAAELVAEMIGRWRQGDRVLPEAFLTRHPELWHHPEAAADLIYEELCLRQEYAAEVPVEQVLGRFPQWRPQLAVLFDCQRLLGPGRPAPQFPAVGDFLGDFLLLAELGRGGLGRVFLAGQLSLADRPVVLKVTPGEAREHLSLARLQHTHIVPLYSVEDLPARGLRALCMPYFGGTTLSRLLEMLRDRPPARRTGQDLLDALDRAARDSPLGPGGGPAPWRQFLAQASYTHAVCWVCACLADALQYAHERGLVHLDLKPSNVLLAADGTPMLLDFHLAREPVRPGGPTPDWLGGTPGYMSPEQKAAVVAVQRGRAVSQPVDGRSDVYSLGVVLYEALAGGLPELQRDSSSVTTLNVPPVGPQRPHRRWRPLHHANPQVSVGLADVIDRCLTDNSRERYPHMAALAGDLRRHLAHLPLAGVRNRSLGERWRKWRSRRPHGAALAGMMLAVVTALAAVTLAAVSHFSHRLEEARSALNDGETQLARGDWQVAIGTLERGRSLAHGVPFQGDLSDQLERQLRRAARVRSDAERAALARDVHRLADRIRFLYGANSVPPAGLRGLEASCRGFWENRSRVVERLRPAGGGALDPTLRDELLDVALFWADLHVRLADPAAKQNAQAQARRVLDEAEALLGTSPVLDAERAGSETRAKRAADSGSARTAWEHCALGRSLLRSGDLKHAAEELAQALRLEPQALWSNFYGGLCAYRQGRYADAVTAYSVCIGAAPEAASCFYNRALAFERLGRTEDALGDYEQALRLDPTLAAAALNRGMLHYRAGRYAEALADLRRARELGTDEAVVAFDLLLVERARGAAKPPDHAGP